MANEAVSKKSWTKKLLVFAVIAGAIGAGVAWYLLTETYGDTSTVKADYTVNAFDFIEEFKKSEIDFNKKYSEKIVTVNGRVSSIEPVDSTLNVKMANAEGNYVIFAFQQKDFDKVKQLKEGDSTSVKGSCSGGTYSEILDSRYITFKRCSLNK